MAAEYLFDPPPEIAAAREDLGPFRRPEKLAPHGGRQPELALEVFLPKKRSVRPAGADQNPVEIEEDIRHVYGRAAIRSANVPLVCMYTGESPSPSAARSRSRRSSAKPRSTRTTAPLARKRPSVQ